MQITNKWWNIKQANNTSTGRTKDIYVCMDVLNLLSNITDTQIESNKSVQSERVDLCWTESEISPNSPRSFDLFLALISGFPVRT